MSKKKILIVEDEIIIALDLKMRLENYGYSVLPIAGSARDAVDYAESHRPDVILMDVILKDDETGIDAAREIKRKSSVLIIFTTGNPHLLYDDKGIKIFSETVLSKPCSDQELIGAIESDPFA